MANPSESVQCKPLQVVVDGKGVERAIKHLKRKLAAEGLLRASRVVSAQLEIPLETVVEVVRRLPEGVFTAQAEQEDASDNLGRSEPSTFDVDLTAPRTGDGPARPVEAVEAPGAGGIPAGGLRTYQVTWVHEHGNETAPSPASTPVGTNQASFTTPATFPRLPFTSSP